MLKFICLFALISAAFAASVGSVERTTEKREIIPLLKFEREDNPDGSFKFSYEGGDETFREEIAHVVDAGTEDEALEITGSYRYIDLDGNTVEVHYTAGKNGFVPVGTNILPEISEAARAAADLPHITEEEVKRKARSNDEKKFKVSEQKAEGPTVNKPKNVEDPKTVEAPKEVKDSKVKETTAKKEETVPVEVIEDKAKTA